MRLLFWQSGLSSWMERSRGLLFPFAFALAFVVLTCLTVSAVHASEPTTYKADLIGGVNAVAVTANGKLIAVGGDTGKVGFWDVAKQKEIGTIQASEESIWVLEFSPNGKQLVTADENGVVQLWDVASHKKLAQLHGHKGYVSGLSFSPDGKMLATSGYDGTVRIWSMKDLKSRELIRVSDNVFNDVEFSPDGRTLAASLYLVGVKLWKDGLDAEPVTLEIDNPRGSFCHCLAFSPQGDRLAVTGRYYLQLFEVPTGKLLHSARVFHTAENPEVSFSYEGQDITFSSDGELLAIAAKGVLLSALGPSWKGEVHLWDPKNFRQLRVLRGHTKPVWAVAFLPDGNTLVSGSLDWTVRLWPMRSLRKNHED